jgi:hypothetical protein
MRLRCCNAKRVGPGLGFPVAGRGRGWGLGGRAAGRWGAARARAREGRGRRGWRNAGGRAAENAYIKMRGGRQRQGRAGGHG